MVQARITKSLLWVAAMTLIVTKFCALGEMVPLERGREKGVLS